MSLVSRVRRGLGRLVAVVARPIERRTRGAPVVVVRTYRGYGSHREVFLIGRVFRQPSSPMGRRGDAIRFRLADLWRWLRRWGVAGAVLTARFAGAEREVTSDADGYFRVELKPALPLGGDQLWHDMVIELESPSKVAVRGELFIPPPRRRHVVISDIDDTVMETGVANKARMMWRLFMQRAESRVAFPGMAAFLRALHQGMSGDDTNPMLYVSKAPWPLYEVLDEFFNFHRIPIGPLLFLRDWGLTLQHPLPRRSKDHKLALIRNMMKLYDDLPFILIGDSGQQDPEVYARIVHEHPGRVRAIYIRDVSRRDRRDRAIALLADEVSRTGCRLLLAADSMDMAIHAAEAGLITPAALASVREECEHGGTLPEADGTP